MESLDRIFLVQTVMFFRPSLKTNTRGKALLEKRQPSSTILLLAKSTNAVGPLLRRLPLRPNHNGVSIPGVSTFTKFMNMCNFSDSYQPRIIIDYCHLPLFSIRYILVFEYVMYQKNVIIHGSILKSIKLSLFVRNGEKILQGDRCHVPYT